MISRRHFVIGLSGTLLPLPAFAQAQWGVVRDLIGDVTLNGLPVTRQTALQPGQTLATGSDGNVRFTIANDAFFLRPNSRLRLEATRPSEPFIDFFRLVTGALGATFERGMRRSVVTPSSTIGIRGTGVYIEAASEWTYACTCFGTTELSSSLNERIAVPAFNHEARLIRPSVPIERAPMAHHTSEEIAALEAMVGRPNPFKS
jgi:hypothetical protein